MTPAARDVLVVSAALLFAVHAAQSQTTVTLTPVADASIDYLFADANLGSQDTLEVGYLSERHIRRALIRFNLAAAVPGDAVIDSAQLKLYLQLSDGADPATFLAVLVAEDWIESQVTWNNQPNRDQPTIGVTMNGALGYKSVDVTDIVRAWHNVPHYGLELRGPEGDPLYRRVFSSRENSETPPQLVVNYHVPVPPTATPTRTPTRTSTPTSTLTPANCVELLMNGDFENGDLSPWQASGNARLGPGRNSAAGVLMLGESNAVDQVSQNVGIPAAATLARLDFWWIADGGVDQPNDILIAFALHQTGATELKTVHAVAPFGQWQHETLDVSSYAGQLQAIAFTAYSDAAQPSSFMIDDVSLMACGVPTAGVTSTPTHTPTPTRTSTRVTATPTQSPTPTTTLPPNCLDVLHNGDFESAALPPWEANGDVTVGAGHFSTYGAALGGADNATGDLAQTVSLPAGANPVRLEFWWLADSVTPQDTDTLTVIVQNGHQSDELRVLRAAAPLGLWQQEAVDVSAYAGQSIAVTFAVRTDATQPSTFSVDDVSLKVCNIPTPSRTATTTRTASPTATFTVTRTSTPTRTPTRTPTAAASVTPTATATSTMTPPPTATPAAASQLVTFEETIADPGTVRSQYCNDPVTNKGVEFLGNGGRIHVPNVGTASPTHALTNFFPGQEFGQTDSLTISFTAAQGNVEMKVGVDRAYAFDVSAEIAAYSSPVPSPETLIRVRPIFLGRGPLPITERLTISNVPSNIRSVEVTFFGPGAGNAAFEVIDDLSFSQGGPPCVEDTTKPAVSITRPATDGQTVYPQTELAFVATDNESGVAKVRVAFLGAGGSEIGAFHVCGAPGVPPCSLPVTTVSGDFDTVVPQGTVAILVQAWNFGGLSGQALRVVQLTEPPAPTTNLWVLGVEVTQAIQPWVATSNTSRSTDILERAALASAVSMVAGKRTYVRVYPGLEGTAGPVLAQARLTCANLFFTPCPGPQELDGGALVVNPINNNDLNELRRDVSKSWNFELPAAWTETNESLRLTARVYLRAPFQECPGCKDGANSLMVTGFVFHPAAPLTIVPIRACVWRSAGAPVCDISPTATYLKPFQDLTSLLVQTYPVAEKDLRIHLRSPNVIAINGTFVLPGAPMTSDRMNAFMDDVCDLASGDIFQSFFSSGQFPFDHPFVYLGIVPPPVTSTAGLGRPNKACAIAKMDPANIENDTGTVAQEIGHALGFNWHASCDHGEDQQSTPCLAVPGTFPCQHGGICTYGFRSVSYGSLTLLRSVDPGDTTVEDKHTHDFMSYGGGELWISPYVYKLLYTIFSLSGGGGTALQRLTGSAGRGEVLWVRGTIFLDDEHAELTPFYHLPEGQPAVEPGSGAFSLELQDASGLALFTRFFDVPVNAGDTCCGDDPDRPATGAFFETLPFADSVARIVLRHGERVLAVRERDQSVPSAAVLTPDAGTAWVLGETAEITWDAVDPEGDELFYLVQYSTDGGTTWSTAAQDITDSHFAVDNSVFAGSDQARIRVLASDGVNTAVGVSDVFRVDRKAPLAWIGAPTSGSATSGSDAVPEYEEGAPVVLQGGATDQEDGPLPDEQLTWLSQPVGNLGTGHRIDVTTLPPGTHEITLQAEDSDGQVGVDHVTVKVLERVDTQPIADAGPDQTVAPGAVVQLDGTGSSDADGDLLRFSWSLVSQPLGSTVSMSDTGDSKPALSVDRQGTYEVALVVHDGKVGSVPDTLVIRVACSGDCKGDNQVTVDELLTMVNIALGNADVATCDAGDANSDRQITIDEIIAAVNNALNGCGEQ